MEINEEGFYIVGYKNELNSSKEEQKKFLSKQFKKAFKDNNFNKVIQLIQQNIYELNDFNILYVESRRNPDLFTKEPIYSLGDLFLNCAIENNNYNIVKMLLDSGVSPFHIIINNKINKTIPKIHELLNSTEQDIEKQIVTRLEYNNFNPCAVFINYDNYYKDEYIKKRKEILSEKAREFASHSIEELKLDYALEELQYEEKGCCIIA